MDQKKPKTVNRLKVGCLFETAYFDFIDQYSSREALFLSGQ
jgi:hypothetical protein